MLEKSADTTHYYCWYKCNGTASSPSMAEKARPQEVRRIFTMGLPFTANHGGQILFGPADGYLYIMMGDEEVKAIHI
ncbi:UNVERIFIED_CONTAM: HIPL1 protein [Sesamum radiatum]|uniref:HIPL1 protein n=1 Tax=Sesamum radiatum TaxID=300843 RepID=A0AAW2MXP1_SESRA